MPANISLMLALGKDAREKQAAEMGVGDIGRTARLQAYDSLLAGTRNLRQNHFGHYLMNPFAATGPIGYGPLDELYLNARQGLMGGMGGETERAVTRQGYRDKADDLNKLSPAKEDKRMADIHKLLQSVRKNPGLDVGTAAMMM